MKKSRAQLILLALVTCSTGTASAEEVGHPVIQEPVFKAASNWTFHVVTFQNGKPVHSVDGEWTLLWANRGGGWSYTFVQPQRRPPHGASASPPFVTDTSWNGWDSLSVEKDRDSILPFPMQAGKTWKTEFDNRQDHWQCEHQAVNWENVTVAAGTFMALKLTETCTISSGKPFAAASSTASADAAMRPAAASDAASTRHVTTTFWYSPEVQHFVKQDRVFDGQGESNSFELSSFRLAK